MSPDSSLMMGNWTDAHLRNYYILNFNTLNDAMAESYKYPDINWQRIVLNHEHIFARLKGTIQHVIRENNFQVDFNGHLMTGDEFKNKMFDRVLQGGRDFSLKSDFTDLVTFTITNPWSSVLCDLSNALELYREWMTLDVLRIREKKVVDGVIICLYGSMESGAIYTIRLVPSLLNQWGQWYLKVGYRSDKHAMKLYDQLLKKQCLLDGGPSIA